MARHDIRIDVNRVNRVRDRDAIFVAENVQDESAIALRSVRNEDLVVRNLDSAVAEIILRNRAAQKFVPFVWRITAKCFAMSEFLDRAMHRVDCSARQRLGHIADAAADQVLRRVRMAIDKLLHPPSYLGKEIAGLELKIYFVEVSHSLGGR